MKKIYQFPVTHLLRWGFEYHDHKPKKVGMWSRPGVCEHSSAWRINKENLSCAFIETKNITSRVVKPKVICDGQDYMNFQWVSGKSMFGSNTQLIGLSMLTRKEKITVYIDGTISRRKITGFESVQHLAGYGK